MALVKCKECGTEKSDQVKQCPKCGFKEKRKANKKLITIISVVLIVLIGGTATIVVITKNDNIRQQQKLEQEYNELLIKTSADIYTNGIVSQYHCSKISSTWYSCISSKYCSNFDAKIQTYLSNNKTYLNKLSENKDKIEKNMQSLKNIPSEEYQDAYDKLVELYGTFVKLVDQSINPSGNYNTYINNYNKYSSDFKSSYDQLVVLRPEIKDYENKDIDDEL